MNQRYRVSRWSNVFIRGQIAAVWHSISLARVFLPEPLGSRLQGLKGRVLTEAEVLELAGDHPAALDCLKKGEFIVPSTADEMLCLKETRERLLQEVSLDKMYLLLTDGCDMACRYCSEEIVDLPRFRQQFMTAETIDRSVECFARLTKLYGGRKPRRSICLYGGEPLLNRVGIFHAVKRITEAKTAGVLPDDIFVYVLTNGQPFDEAYARLFAQHGVAVSISIDGPKPINDANRLGRSGTSPFEKARQAYCLAKERGVDVGISTTLTPEVVEHFDETLDFFIHDLGLRECITLFLLHYTPCFPVEPDYYEKAARCLIKARERFSALGINDESMRQKIEAFSNRTPILAECGINGGTLVVAPEGAIGPCVDLVKPRLHMGGSVHDRDYDPVKAGLYASWRFRSPLFMEKCLDCPAVGLCGGGCPVKVECQTGSRWDIDYRICPHSKLALEWLVWKAYDERDKNSDFEVAWTPRKCA